jgi:hypothetical protein
LYRRHRDIFGIAAADQERADLVADFPLRDAATERGDLARCFEAEDIRRPAGTG